jgi:hypothetical protein
MPLYPSFPDIQTVVVTGSVVTTAVQSGSYTVVISGTQVVTGTVALTNPVIVSNFPAIQTITGSVSLSQPATVSVSNFPGIQTVTGTVTSVITGTVQTAVTNFPAVQTITGTVAISPQPLQITTTGSLPVTVISIPNITGSVNVTNSSFNITGSVLAIPTGTQTIAGTVTSVITGTVQTSVTNFPVVQAITGTVAITPQPISVQGTVTSVITGTVQTSVQSLPNITGSVNVTNSSFNITGSVGVNNTVYVTGTLGVDNVVRVTTTGSIPIDVRGWFGSVFPSVGTKAASGSIPVTLPSDQTITVQDVGAAGSNPSYYAIFDRIVPGLNKVMAALYNTSSSKKIVIYRIFRYNWQVVAVTGVTLEQYLARMSSVTTGTLAPIVYPHDTNDAVNPGTLAYISASFTENNLLRRFFASNEEINLLGSGLYNVLGLDYGAPIFERHQGARGLVLRQNQGVFIRNVTNSNVGSVSYIFEFTIEDA